MFQSSCYFLLKVQGIYYHPQTKLREGNVFTGVCLSFCWEGWGPHVTITHDGLGHEYPLLWIPDMGPPPIPDIGPTHHPLLLTSGGHHQRPVHTCSLEDLPLPILTSSGGHRNTYGWQVGGTHPTGMLLVTNLSFDMTTPIKFTDIKNGSMWWQIQTYHLLCKK